MRGSAVASPSPAVHTAGWLVLTIDHLHLALPQYGVRQIELLSDLWLKTGGGSSELGWLPRDDGDPWPAYGLDGALRRQHSAPEARRVCVFLADEGRVFGVVCDRVRSLAAYSDLKPEPIPDCMTGLRSPLTGFARYQGGITCVTQAAVLHEYLVSRAGPAHGTHE